MAAVFDMPVRAVLGGSADAIESAVAASKLIPVSSLFVSCVTRKRVCSTSRSYSTRASTLSSCLQVRTAGLRLAGHRHGAEDVVGRVRVRVKDCAYVYHSRVCAYVYHSRRGCVKLCDALARCALD